MRVLLLAAVLALAACGQPDDTSKPTPKPAAPTGASPSEEADPATAAQAPDAPPIPPAPAGAGPESGREHATAKWTARVKDVLRSDDPIFASHPAPVLTGPLAPARPQGDDRQFMTRITQDSEQAGINFAGHNTIVRVGCGTGCSFGWVVDRKTGKVRGLGLGGEEQSGVELVFRPDSRLIKAGWEEDYKCHYQAFLWTGERLEPVGEPLVFGRDELEGYCPRRDD